MYEYNGTWEVKRTEWNKERFTLARREIICERRVSRANINRYRPIDAHVEVYVETFARRWTFTCERKMDILYVSTCDPIDLANKVVHKPRV